MTSLYQSLLKLSWHRPTTDTEILQYAVLNKEELPFFFGATRLVVVMSCMA